MYLSSKQMLHGISSVNKNHRAKSTQFEKAASNTIWSSRRYTDNRSVWTKYKTKL